MTLRDKMLAVIADVNASVAEREELVEMIAIALLTRKNLFVLPSRNMTVWPSAGRNCSSARQSWLPLRKWLRQIGPTLTKRSSRPGIPSGRSSAA